MAPPYLVGTTARDWAAAKGLCKAHSRGRMPNAAVSAIEEAKRQGMVFEDPAYLAGLAVRGSVRPADDLENPGETETPDEAAEALSASAKATQAKILALHEGEIFEAMSMRFITYIDGAGHRVRASTTARRDLFWTFTSLTLGPAISMSTDKGWRSFPISKLVKIGSRNPKAVADDIERRKRISDARQRKQDAS